MSEYSEQTVKQHVRIYLAVFAALAFFTVVTVTVSTLSIPIAVAIGVALFIATLKVSLVAGFFMHLAFEKKIIHGLLSLAVVFLLALLFLIAYS